jgi:enoyl-CoA hydratase/carnithine racemase
MPTMTFRVIVLTGAGDTFCSGVDFSGGAAPFDSPDENSSSPPRQVAALKIALHRRVVGTDDARAGVAAFLERRPPRWTAWDPSR